MLTVNEAKQQLSDALEREAKSHLESEAGKALLEAMSKFGDDPYCKGSVRYFDENGEYVSGLEVEWPFHELDKDLQREIVLQASDGVYLVNSPNSKDEKIMQVFLGEPVTLNFSDTRNCYSIHSSELGLKVNYKELTGNDDAQKLSHALYLIECTMRKMGIFPNIVELDYYGQAMKELTTNLGTMTDQELREYGKQFDESEE